MLTWGAGPFFRRIGTTSACNASSTSLDLHNVSAAYLGRCHTPSTSNAATCGRPSISEYSSASLVPLFLLGLSNPRLACLSNVLFPLRSAHGDSDTYAEHHPRCYPSSRSYLALTTATKKAETLCFFTWQLSHAQSLPRRHLVRLQQQPRMTSSTCIPASDVYF